MPSLRSTGLLPGLQVLVFSDSWSTGLQVFVFSAVVLSFHGALLFLTLLHRYHGLPFVLLNRHK